MIRIERLHPHDFARMPGLVALLQDAVASGASVGFLHPLETQRGWDFWLAVIDGLSDLHFAWIALEGEQVVGTVQMELIGKENQPHRAEVMKLLVHSAHRRKGVAAKLMQALEVEARKHGRSTLVLDTEAQSDAESFYQQAGWLRVGEIPDYALSADGQKVATAYYYKLL